MTRPAVPASTDPAGADPPGTDPAGTDPASTDPAGTGSAGTGPLTVTEQDGVGEGGDTGGGLTTRGRSGPGARATARVRATLGDHLRVVLLAVGLLVLVVISFGLGRYALSPATVVRVLAHELFGIEGSVAGQDRAVVMDIRMPRILAALLVGAALASSGAAYQTMFRNPLVSPEILGVAAGAGFGASVSILIGLDTTLLQIISFGCGLLAAVLSLIIARVVGKGSLIILVLGGIIIGAMFNALISSVQYFANPETTLPEITFWLFGSLARASMHGLIVPAIIVAVCLTLLYAVRWQLTVLATGDDEARSLGVNRTRIWALTIGASTLMTATAVSVAGIIGWVGLVVPHLARFTVGPSFNRLLPVTALIGAGYLLAVDDVARTASSLDLPLGILTALIGAPFFVALLAKAGRQWL
ncbi:ABC-type Fe3+-siderophore transport system, permease component [Frankia torreyi]|uniref:ABC-type Fe3+-siderophore transport system, permease component n=3 Tax=Frankia TaxID=1854 RepID=A0A0D8BBG6_9ACTN|nr:ABC-type Fe3+-siderophore transport system, permease component [Frankia torreyi]